MAELLVRKNGRWGRFGRSETAPTPGAYVPGPDTTGPSGALTPYAGSITVTLAGTVIENLDVFGKITVQAANVTIRNCRVRGHNAQATNGGIIQATSAACSGLVVEDCLLVPDYVHVYWTGIIGHDYTVRRTEVYGTVDGFGVYNTTNANGAANVTISACWVHDLAYIEPDPNHGDNRTHNDCIQVQGNSNITISGNLLEANASATLGTPGLNPYSPSVTGQAIGLTPNVGPITNVTISDNWLDYGASSITIIPGSHGTSTTAIITGNRFGRNQVLVGGVRRPITVDPSLTIPNFPASTGPDTASGNTWLDNGSPVTIYRMAG